MVDFSYVRNYISDKATVASRQKGFVLYKSKKVTEISISKDYRNLIAKVQGSMLYHVDVLIDGSKIRSSDCNCPYNYSGICKHQIAALYEFSDYLSKNTLNEIIDTSKRVAKQGKIVKSRINTSKVNKLIRNSGDNIEIPNYQNLTKKWIKSMSHGGHNYYSQCNLSEIEEDLARFEVENWGGNWHVEFNFIDGKLFSKCDCFTEVNGLCNHQQTTLLEIIDNFGINIFDVFKAEKVIQAKNEIAKFYGLPDSGNSKLFRIIVKDEKLYVLPTGDAEGLVVNSKENASASDIVLSVGKDYDKFQLSESNDNYDLAYVFKISSSRNGEFINFLPISGKLNKAKNRLINPIRVVDDYDAEYVQYSETDDELIKLSELTSDRVLEKNINRHNVDNSNELGMAKVIANHYETIFPKIWALLLTKKFVYITDIQNFSSSDLKQVSIKSDAVKIFFRLSENSMFYELELIVKLGEIEIPISDPELIYHRPLVFEYYASLYLVDTAQADLIIYTNSIGKTSIKAVKSKFSDFFNNYIEPISKKYPIEFNAKSLIVENIIPNNIKKQLYISEFGKFVLFKPFVLYDDNQSNILEHGALIKYDDKGIKETTRDIEFEKEYNDLLQNLHSAFTRQFNDSFFHLEFNEFVKNQWFLNAFEKLKEANVEVFGLNELKKFNYSTHKANVSVNIASGQDWFDVNVNVSFGDENISLKDIKKAVIKGDNFVKLTDGKLGILPDEWLAKFEKYFRQGQIKKDGLKISKLRFSIIDELFDEKDYADIMQEVFEKKQRLKEFTEIKKLRKPNGLKGKLRDYQKAGYNWLNFLDEFKWGGILADDMGLGKTIQILAFLLKISSKSQKANLVIVPTTLLFNWKNEIEKFAPSLSTLFHYGNTRKKQTTDFKSYDLVITTYGIMTRDLELLKKYSFNYIILDESQAIKNPNSQRFKAATLLKANNRLALTGTPIENNTFDLYAQMEFLNPGFLGAQKQFKDNYSDAIDKYQNPIIAAELQNLINPFILRRTKEQVATELPSKTEDFLFCEMEAGQRKVYDAFKNKYRNLLLNRIEDDGLGKSKIYVLEGLMKLRQICDSPEILADKENYGNESVKIKEIIRHIKNKTGKHKILVFSQFVKMLSVIKRELEKEQIIYEYLDGKSTQKARQQSVEHFQSDEKCRVFLISLKAGGTGLNLTAADYVYVVDPWWNPAVENQAIDRCYRIGQNKKVIAYRMICTNTIEEKIMQYQAKKKKIASDIISTDESFIKQLDKSDIEDLFT